METPEPNVEAELFEAVERGLPFVTAASNRLLLALPIGYAAAALDDARQCTPQPRRIVSSADLAQHCDHLVVPGLETRSCI